MHVDGPNEMENLLLSTENQEKIYLNDLTVASALELWQTYVSRALRQDWRGRF